MLIVYFGRISIWRSDYSHLILLGTRHEHGGLDQQPVTGLHLPSLLLLHGRLEAGGVPAVLFVAASQGAGPEKSSHDFYKTVYKSENKTLVPGLTFSLVTFSIDITKIE